MTKLADAFASQSISCTKLGSPFMGRLCTLFAQRLTPGTATTDRLFAWEGDVSSRGHSVPLRLCGALHAQKLQGCSILAPVYPPNDVPDDVLWQAVTAALEAHEAQIMAFLDSPPQTNEIRRSVALIAAGYWMSRHNMPIATRELGASAGLNLHWDQYALECSAGRLGTDDPIVTFAPEWSGPLPQGRAPQVVERKGIDLNPLDPTRAEDALRLRAYLWPDQPERQALTQAAIDAMQPAEVSRGDAIDWLASQLAPKPGHLRMIYHTIAWQYFPAEVQDRGRALIEAAGAQASDDSPLAWVSMEADGTGPGAALTARLWPGDNEHALARVDFHGRWLTWQAD